jgi:hypothetical protein
MPVKNSKEKSFTNTDTSFITNEKKQSLKDRFEVLIKDTSFFDCLVGYFYTSGFFALYKSLEKTKGKEKVDFGKKKAVQS